MDPKRSQRPLDSLSLLAVSGSLRQASYNKGLLRAAAERLPAGVKMVTFDLGELSLFNQDLEMAPPQPIVEWKRLIHEADGLLIATPEYNGSITGVLKNALDWASRPRQDSPLRGKPLAIMGAGGRGGTRRSQETLRQQAQATGMLTMAEPQLLVTMAWEHFDSEGNLTDLQIKNQVSDLLCAFVDWIASGRS